MLSLIAGEGFFAAGDDQEKVCGMRYRETVGNYWDNHLVYREQQAIVEGIDHRLRHRAGFILGENLEI